MVLSGSLVGMLLAARCGGGGRKSAWRRRFDRELMRARDDTAHEGIQIPRYITICDGEDCNNNSVAKSSLDNYIALEPFD